MSAPQVHTLRRSEKRPFALDFGENTAGATTGPLPPGDTVASAVVTVESKPTDAADPTIGTVTVNATAEYVNGRSCSAGEAVKFNVTLASNQTYGDYSLKVTATTTAGYILVACVTFVCGEC
jgi:hypothetical protein